MPESGPQNAVMGGSYGTELPQTEINEQELVNEKKAAKFSKTEEFQKLKEHLEERIGFYQTFLPSGEPIAMSGLVLEEVGRQWLVANTVIGEFRAILNAYEQAREVVEGASRRQNS